MQNDQVGNILRKTMPDRSDPGYVDMYLGNGRFGAVFDAYGFMNVERQRVSEAVVQLPDGTWRSASAPPVTAFMHTDHWVEGQYGLQGLVPLARLLLLNTPEKTDEYWQEHDIYHGQLRTFMRFSGIDWLTSAAFNPQERDIFALQVDYTATHELPLPAIKLEAITETAAFYGTLVSGKLRTGQFDPEGGTWLGNLRIANADTAIGLRAVCENGCVTLSTEPDGVTIHLSGSHGSFLLLVGVAAMKRAEGMTAALQNVTDSSWLQECTSAWELRRGTAGIQIGNRRIQALFDRSVYAMLCSLAPDVSTLNHACGLTNYGWGWVGFCPQDCSYVFPMLLRLGYIDIAKAKIEFLRQCIPAARRGTRRIFRAEGVMWPWEHPVSPEFSLFPGAAPNWYQFEIHNSAYPARMAYETSLYVKDETWIRENAWPVVRESTRFYASIARKEPDSGKWSLFVNPSMGQDELGGMNDANFLCALVSAQYCFETALKLVARLGLAPSAEFEAWGHILQDGLSYNRLFDEEQGIYRTHEHLAPGEGLNQQKHPVQLNPLLFLPLEEGITPELSRAYDLRYELCIGVKDGLPQGWTYPAYLLAASRMGSAEGLLREMEQMEKAHNIDPDYIQIYEDAINRRGLYYITSMGLFMQAISGAMLSDFWGWTVVGSACPEFWGDVSFTSLWTQDGKVLSGQRTEGVWSVEEG